MSKVTEAEFRDAAMNRAIKSAKVVRTHEGYLLIITFTWKEGEFTLYTFRHRPRAWVSLDRMVAYLDRQHLQLHSIELELPKLEAPD